MHRPSPRAALALLLLLPLLLVACGGGDDEPSEPLAPGTVRALDNKFEPKVIEIAVGDTVTWQFDGAALHNVSGPGFKSQNLKKGKTFEHTFNSAGDVDYVCTLHPGMKGTVKVG